MKDDKHTPGHEDHVHTINRNARNGLVLFAIYFALYAGFIYLATFHANLLAAEAPGGTNWAIAYGIGLIGAALGLAAIYMYLCTRPIPGEKGGAQR